jgi:hypothetical protein
LRGTALQSRSAHPVCDLLQRKDVTVAMIKAHLKQYGISFIKEKTWDNKTPLHYLFCLKSSVNADIVRLVLKVYVTLNKGVRSVEDFMKKFNQADRSGLTPLDYAHGKRCGLFMNGILSALYPNRAVEPARKMIDNPMREKQSSVARPLPADPPVTSATFWGRFGARVRKVCGACCPG